MRSLSTRRKRRSKGQQAVHAAKSVANAWTSLNLASASARTAKKSAKAFGGLKAAKLGGKIGGTLLKLLAVPLGAFGAFVLWRKLKGSDEAEFSYTRTEPARTDDTPFDPPAGAANPPVGPTAPQSEPAGSAAS
jgi:hypothetical protein